jgi:hypothetical protein
MEISVSWRVAGNRVMLFALTAAEVVTIAASASGFVLFCTCLSIAAAYKTRQNVLHGKDSENFM